MKLLNPRMTIQNAEGQQWLVTLAHEESDGQRLEITVKVDKSIQSPDAIAQAAAAAALPWVTRLSVAPDWTARRAHPPA